MCVVTLPFTIFYRVKKSTCCNVVDKVVCCNSAFGSCVLRSFSPIPQSHFQLEARKIKICYGNASDIKCVWFKSALFTIR